MNSELRPRCISCGLKPRSSAGYDENGIMQFKRHCYGCGQLKKRSGENIINLSQTKYRPRTQKMCAECMIPVENIRQTENG